MASAIHSSSHYHQNYTYRIVFYVLSLTQQNRVRHFS